MICPSCGSKNPEGIAACGSCKAAFAGFAKTQVGPMPGPGPADDSLQSAVGRTIGGRYQIRGLLGRGGVGTVYRAWDLELKEEIAIKLLPPGSDRDPDEQERFKREIVVARRITHPNVVRIHDFGVSGSDGYISMQLLPGGTLAARMRRGRVPIDEAVTISTGIADGLAAAHREGIVHRDIKPENVLFDAVDRPILVDFGMARLANATARTMGFSGTPFYMSPETADGREATARSDVYSLGVVLYELFTGKLPFTSESLVRLALLHTNEKVPSMRALRPDLPPPLEKIVLACLAKDPATRYADAGAVAKAFRMWSMGATEGFAPVADDSGDDEEGEDAPPANRMRVLVGVMLSLAGIAALVFASMKLFPEEDPYVLPPALPPTVMVVAATPVPTPTATATGTATASAFPSATPVAQATRTPKPIATRTTSAVRPTPVATPTKAAVVPVGEPGLLTIQAYPWGRMYLDGAKTPIGEEAFIVVRKHALSAGSHRVRVENGAGASVRHVEFNVDVVAGKLTRVEVDFRTETPSVQIVKRNIAPKP